MGIRGLTTFIAKRSDSYLEPYQLHSCFLVIDANSLASQLYNLQSSCNCSFGGDYDRYTNCINSFFSLLLKCEISPLVIFDGGYDERKLQTVYTRLQNKIYNAKSITPATQYKNKCFPLLMKEVFKDVVRKMKIPLAQSFYEADNEIAAIARMLQCPVLSYDSDFYVYDVLYIPFTTLQFEPCRDEGSEVYYLKCELYKVEKFLNSFGGLKKSLLPLMATLLGNDYVKCSLFNNFFSQLKRPRSRMMNETQKKISALLEWLQKESLRTAVLKILGHIKKNKRAYLSQQIKRTIASYVQCTSELLAILGIPWNEDIISASNGFKQFSSEILEFDIPVEKKSSEEENVDKLSDSEICVEESTNVEDESYFLYTSGVEFREVLLETLPHWFKSSFQEGHFPSYFMDMLTHGKYFFVPQVEDYALPFSHSISLPIVRVIYGLLVKGRELEDKPLTYYARNAFAQTEKFSLPAVYATASLEFMPLEHLPDLSQEKRQRLLLETMQIRIADAEMLAAFPSSWQLFLLALVYWATQMTQPTLNICHVHALLFSMILLNVVDGHVGYCRSKKTLQKEHGNWLKKLSKSKPMVETAKDSELKQIPTLNSNTNFLSKLDLVSKSECLLLVETLLSYHQMDAKLKSSPKLYSLLTVHAFSQFQSCLSHVMHLNALLSFPFPQCHIANFYSGTVIYNIYKNLRRRSDVLIYISHILSQAPTILTLYKMLAVEMLAMIPDISLKKSQGRHHRKKMKHRYCNKQAQVVSNVAGTFQEEMQDEFKDINNSFLALSILSETE